MDVITILYDKLNFLNHYQKLENIFFQNITTTFIQKLVTYLIDNDPKDSYHYLIKVQTGKQSDAGTTSHIGIRIRTEHSKSEVLFFVAKSHESCR